MSDILTFTALSKSWFGVPAVKDLTLSVREGSVLGLIGQNGAGKSTLMNMIGGVVPPTSGQMHWRNLVYEPRTAADATKAGIAFIHQELNLFTNLTVAENLYIDGFPRRFGLIDYKTIAARAKAILKRLNLDVSPQTIVGQLSPGERQLVEVAKALHNNASLIILDEPTTSLTPRETARLFETLGTLRAEGRTLIYISHILGDVARLCDDIAVLRDGSLVDQGASAGFPVPRMIRSMIGRDLAGMYPPRTTLPTETTLLQASGLSQPGILENVSFTVRRGEVVGLFGLMGSGRSELARILFGLDPVKKGELNLDGIPLVGGPRERIAAGIAFVTENRREEGLMMEASIASNLSIVNIGSYRRGPLALVDTNELAVQSEASKQELGIKAGDISVQPVKALSGGNQQKVVIGKWLFKKPKLFILDEPTRGVDVGAKFEIYALADKIASDGNGILFISSELDELIGMADRIVVMSRGEIMGEIARADFDSEKILSMAFREVST